MEYPDSGKAPPIYGPHITTLKAYFWKIRCSPKIKHFLWQLVSGCLSVKKNLWERGIQCDSQCARCGAEEESINHVY